MQTDTDSVSSSVQIAHLQVESTWANRQRWLAIRDILDVPLRVVSTRFQGDSRLRLRPVAMSAVQFFCRSRPEPEFTVSGKKKSSSHQIGHRLQ